MANGNGSLAHAWEDFDDPVKLGLAINELDRIYRRLDDHSRESSTEHGQIRVEMTNAIAAIKADFNARLDASDVAAAKRHEAFRTEVRESFDRVDARQTKTTSWLIGAVGTLLVGLALLVAQLASGT